MITVADILNLNTFKEAILVSGKGGLGNVVKNASVIEMPINTEASKKLVYGNEFYITSLFAYKNNQESIFQLFEQLIEEGCSGICIIDKYIDFITDDIKNFAEHNNFPVILISRKIPYFQILEEIFREIIASKDVYYMLKQLDLIPLNDHDGRHQIEAQAKKLNPYFLQFNCAVYITTALRINVMNILKTVNILLKKEFLMCEYANGYVVLLTFNSQTLLTREAVLFRLRECISSVTEEYSMGISALHDDISGIRRSINQAVEANSACRILNRTAVAYDNMGILKLLFQLKDNSELIRFKDEILEPIKEYEAKKGTELYETALKFVECDGNHNLTAEKLKIHVNTLRYRINMIKSLLKKDSSIIDFYESLSIAVKAEKIFEVSGFQNRC